MPALTGYGAGVRLSTEKLPLFPTGKLPTERRPLVLSTKLVYESANICSASPSSDPTPTPSALSSDADPGSMVDTSAFGPMPASSASRCAWKWSPSSEREPTRKPDAPKSTGGGIACATHALRCQPGHALMVCQGSFDMRLDEGLEDLLIRPFASEIESSGGLLVPEILGDRSDHLADFAVCGDRDGQMRVSRDLCAQPLFLGARLCEVGFDCQSEIGPGLRNFPQLPIARLVVPALDERMFDLGCALLLDILSQIIGRLEAALAACGFSEINLDHRTDSSRPLSS